MAEAEDARPLLWNGLVRFLRLDTWCLRDDVSKDPSNYWNRRERDTTPNMGRHSDRPACHPRVVRRWTPHRGPVSLKLRSIQLRDMLI